MPGARFDFDADTLEGAAGYFRARAVQGLVEGFTGSGVVEPLVDAGVTWGARTRATDAEGALWQSVYVLRSHRGRGHFGRYLRATEVPVVTAPDCEIEALLARYGVPYRVVGHFTRWREYEAIAARYGGDTARRSGVPLMHHIDEGLAVLRSRAAGESAMRAFCLHPLLQEGSALRENFPRLGALSEDPAVVALAMEYRATANACLSWHAPCPPEAIGLSPLEAVNAMLVADKVQNAKDFILHHRATHPRSARLEDYFKRWLARLEISRETFGDYFTRLQPGEPRPLPADW